MTKLISCRRTLVSVLAVLCLTFLGYRGADVSQWIATIAIGLAAANAYQGKQ